MILHHDQDLTSSASISTSQSNYKKALTAGLRNYTNLVQVIYLQPNQGAEINKYIEHSNLRQTQATQLRHYLIVSRLPTKLTSHGKTLASLTEMASSKVTSVMFYRAKGRKGFLRNSIRFSHRKGSSALFKKPKTSITRESRKIHRPWPKEVCRLTSTKSSDTSYK